ncbi:MAG: hemerythrin domain-containing protein [Clostridia bacterium]|nr:hemerythrin domain-containing protein [Clostridia bacterium]
MHIINVLMDEHQNILKMIEVIRSAMNTFMATDELNHEDLYDMFDFIKNYADQHHHGKEEIYLFSEMIAHIGPTANKLITHGMLVEHDFGRMYVTHTLNALKDYLDGNKASKIDIISNAIAYGELLKRHIHKEDRVVFTLATRELPKDIMEHMNEQAQQFEIEFSTRPTKYLNTLRKLQEKYI